VLRVIDEDLRGSLLQGEVLAIRVGKRLASPLPAAAAAGSGDGGQGVLLPFADPVFGEQFAEFLGSDATLPGFDPADLGPVTFQHAGGVLKDEFQVLGSPCSAGDSNTHTRW
jgi:hypothetical protein